MAWRALASFIAHTEASTGSELPRFITNEFDAFPECGILADGFLRPRCGECNHDKLLVFSRKRRGFGPSSGARRMSQSAAHRADQVVPHVPVRQRVRVCEVRLPIPLRVLHVAQPELVAPVLQVVHRLISGPLLDDAGLGADEGQGGALTLIQHFGSAASLNLHLYNLVLDSVYRCGADGSAAIIAAAAPSDDDPDALLQTDLAEPGADGQVARCDRFRRRPPIAESPSGGAPARRC